MWPIFAVPVASLATVAGTVLVLNTTPCTASRIAIVNVHGRIGRGMLLAVLNRKWAPERKILGIANTTQEVQELRDEFSDVSVTFVEGSPAKAEDLKDAARKCFDDIEILFVIQEIDGTNNAYSDEDLNRALFGDVICAENVLAAFSSKMNPKEAAVIAFVNVSIPGSRMSQIRNFTQKRFMKRLARKYPNIGLIYTQVDPRFNASRQVQDFVDSLRPKFM